MNHKEIAMAFSHGKFEDIYTFLSDDVVWTIVEEETFSGKAAVVENCKNVEHYFQSVTTIFTTEQVLEDAQKVAISGTAEFIKDGTRRAFVSACDLYEFNSKNELISITSYCISRK